MKTNSFAIDGTFFHPTEDFMDKLCEVIGDRFVIEIGSGEGLLLKALVDRGVKALGIDPFSDFKAIPLTRRSCVWRGNEDTSLNLITNIIMANPNTVFLVARPCHSGFPNNYFRRYCYSMEMIYIGYMKNLEIDFERETSNIRLLDFPKHPDCDCVAVLSQSNYKTYEDDWRNIDSKIWHRTTQDINIELIKWFLEKNKEGKNIKQTETRYSSFGDDWDKYEGCPLWFFDLNNSRKIEVDQHSYMVGGAHYYNTIETEDEHFLVIKEDGVRYKAQPWDKFELRPTWYNEKHYAGLRDTKRTNSVMGGLIWLKEQYLEFERHYKQINQSVYLALGSGLEYELEQILEKLNKNETN